MATANTADVNFPREEEVVITLRIRVASVEDHAYFFQDKEVQAGFLADCFDMLDSIREHIITINGKTYRQLHEILQSNV